MPVFDEWVAAVASAAAVWADPEAAARRLAVRRTLTAPNRFTEEALAYAINQQMHLLTPSRLHGWLGGKWASATRRVGVWPAGRVPLDGLRAVLAVVLTGHQYVGVPSPADPYLLPAFADEVRLRAPYLPAAFVGPGEDPEAEAVIAFGDVDRLASARAVGARSGIPEDACHLRGGSVAVAVLDGKEQADEREGLAEDALLHEGLGPGHAALVWAPSGLAPDLYLEAFAAFRGVFPPHPNTPGALQMQRAFVKAAGLPHAYGEGLEFLISRGPPAFQMPGHVRWSDYEDLGQVTAWLQEHADAVSMVLCRSGLRDGLETGLPVRPFGEAHRQPLDRPDGLLAFLARL